MPQCRNFELRILHLQLNFQYFTGLLQIKVVSPGSSCASRICQHSGASTIAIGTDVPDDRTGVLTIVLTEFSTYFYFGVRRLTRPSVAMGGEVFFMPPRPPSVSYIQSPTERTYSMEINFPWLGHPRDPHAKQLLAERELRRTQPPRGSAVDGRVHYLGLATPERLMWVFQTHARAPWVRGCQAHKVP